MKELLFQDKGPDFQWSQAETFEGQENMVQVFP